MNIVIVDDTVDHLDLLTEFVSELRPGANIYPLQDGRELSKHLCARPVDLVMMDLMMPSISGFDLVQRIREAGQWKNLPIIAVSGLRQKGYHDTLRNAGFNDYIAKPYDFEELARVLDHHLPR